MRQLTFDHDHNYSDESEGLRQRQHDSSSRGARTGGGTTPSRPVQQGHRHGLPTYGNAVTVLCIYPTLPMSDNFLWDDLRPVGSPGEINLSPATGNVDMATTRQQSYPYLSRLRPPPTGHHANGNGGYP